MALKNNPTGWRGLAIWILCGLVSLGFLIAGVAKVTASDVMVANFARWHYPGWFMYAVGLAEIGGALLLVIPRLATLGGVGLAVLMVGAVFTHLGNGEGIGAAMPATIFLLLCLGIAYLRRKSLETLIGSLTAARG